MINFPLQISDFNQDRFLIKTPASGVLIDLSQNIYVMGILNLSPDSFYIGYSDEKSALDAAEKMIQGGADIIDVGGQSARPGSDEIPPDEEIRRIKIIGKLRKNFPNVPISIDTYKSEVAKVAFDLGADILNDISAFRFDPEIKNVCQKYKAPVILMHTTAKPKIMQEKCIEDDNSVIDIIKSYLLISAQECESMGLKPIIDPGIGFGKKPHQNLIIISRIDELVKSGYPVLLGASRKSFIGYCLNPSEPLPPSERLEGTIAVSVLALLKGVRIFRVHDVKENVRALLVSKSVLLANSKCQNR